MLDNGKYLNLVRMTLVADDDIYGAQLSCQSSTGQAL